MVTRIALQHDGRTSVQKKEILSKPYQTQASSPLEDIHERRQIATIELITVLTKPKAAP